MSKNQSAEVARLVALHEETLRVVRTLSENAARARQAADKAFSQEKFNALPALVSRSVFMAWTGLNRHDLKAGITAGEIQTHTRNGGSVAKYFKHQIATMGGFKL